MVDDYRDERARQVEIAGGWRNEAAHAGAVVFKRWLQVYPWPCREEEQRARRDGPDVLMSA